MFRYSLLLTMTRRCISLIIHASRIRSQVRVEVKVVLDHSWHQLFVISLQGRTCCDETTALHSGFVKYAPHFWGQATMVSSLVVLDCTALHSCDDIVALDEQSTTIMVFVH